MPFEPNRVYHIFNQGNNKQNIFFLEKNYLYFLKKMCQYISPHVDFIAYCLMPNHFHWLVRTKPSACEPSKAIKPRTNRDARHFQSALHLEQEYQQKLSTAIGTMLSSYTKAINNQENRTGSLFRPKTKYKDGWINDFITVEGKNKELIFSDGNEYLLRCFEYIHNNPVKAGLVVKSTDWAYSSAKDYGGLRNGTLCNQAIIKEIYK